MQNDAAEKRIPFPILHSGWRAGKGYLAIRASVSCTQKTLWGGDNQDFPLAPLQVNFCMAYLVPTVDVLSNSVLRSECCAASFSWAGNSLFLTAFLIENQCRAQQNQISIVGSNMYLETFGEELEMVRAPHSIFSLSLLAAGYSETNTRSLLTMEILKKKRSPTATALS